jgi:hypothetical protein
MNYTSALNRFTAAVLCKKCAKPIDFELMVDFDDIPQREGDSFEAARALCCGLDHVVKGTFLGEI